MADLETLALSIGKTAELEVVRSELEQAGTSEVHCLEEPYLCSSMVLGKGEATFKSGL